MPTAMVGLARPLGFVLIGVGIWSCAMLGLVPFNGGGVIFAAVVIGYIGWRRAGGIDKAWLRAHWRTWALSEVFFLLAMAMVVFIRSRNADPWGTERPMDYAFFNSVMHSPSFPPLDPWMSGFTINYYYAGYILAAIPAVLTAADPVVSYNLALATTAGMSAAAVVSIVIAVITQWRPNERPLSRGEAPVMATLAVVALLVVGNLGGFLQIVTGVPEVLALESTDIRHAIGNGLGSREPIQLSQTFKGWDFDGATSVTPRDTWADFNWWNPSRAVWDTIASDNGSTERRYAITEFPFFSFWLGDMHPHVMALPFVLLLMALALRRASGKTPDLVLPALLLGLLYPLNSWDYPTYMLLYVGAVVWYGLRNAVTWKDIAIEIGIVAVASYAWYLPFHLSYHSLVGGADPLVTTPVIGALSRYFGPAPARTEFHGLFIMFGLFLVPILIAVARMTRTNQERIMLAVTLVVGVIGAFTGFVSMTAIPLTVLALYMIFTRTDMAPMIVIWLGMTAIAALLCLAVDVVYVRDVFSSRMNTVFKFYYQVWVIWSVAGVLSAWYVWQVGQRWVRVGLCVATIPILLAALVYPAATVGKALFVDQPGNLAGRTPRDNPEGGHESIVWLRANAPAGSVIVEGVGGQYDIEGKGFGGVSASTGLPAVMGWPGHEDQWRGGHLEAKNQIGARDQDVRTIYSSGDEATVRPLLEKYHVRYVYVGPTERDVYGEGGLGLFDSIATVAFQQGQITIYEFKK
jgi:YYY domain-containing protein